MPSIVWPRLVDTLQPRTGERFALVRDLVTGTMLLVDLVVGYVVMSDSVPEREMNATIIERAHGDVLCLGYGLGFIFGPLVARPEVRSVTVLELRPEVLTLVASQQDFGPKLRVVQADSLTWQPDMAFDVIWDDCDYMLAEIIAAERAGVPSDNARRLAPWLKPGGLFLRWCDDGRYRR